MYFCFKYLLLVLSFEYLATLSLSGKLRKSLIFYDYEISGCISLTDYVMLGLGQAFVIFFPSYTSELLKTRKSNYMNSIHITST